MIALPSCFGYVPGWYRSRFVPDGDFDAAHLAWRQTHVRMGARQIPVPRLTAWYGDPGASYTYGRVRHDPLPWTPALTALRERLEAETGARFNSCLGNLYRDGDDSVAWHADDEPELGADPVIASISLGSRRAFKIRTVSLPRHQWQLHLGLGDLLVMRGPSQSAYQHAIPKTAVVVGTRVNLTFRWIGARP